MSTPATVPPIQSKSTRWFGVAWLLTILGCALIYPAVTFGFLNFYRSTDVGFAEFVYRQKRVITDRRASAPGRLFLVGGSNVLFGIDAELIERKIGVPTINYGTYAWLGVDYLLDRAAREMRAGDTVLLSPEYRSWFMTASETADPGLQYIWTYDRRQLLRSSPTDLLTSVNSVRLSDFSDSVKGWIAVAKRDQFRFRDMVTYNVGSIGPNGDIRWVPPLKTIPPQTQFEFPTPDVRSVQSMKSFAATAKAKGVRVLFSWPNFVRPEPALSERDALPPASLTELFQDCGITVLDAPLDNAFPRAWFLDTEYHVNAACRRVRTEELIRRLRPIFGLPPAPEQTTGVLLVNGTSHRLTAGNLFDGDPGVRVRMLSPGDVNDSRALTPSAVAELARQGVPVYSEPGLEPMLAPAKLALQAGVHGRETIQGWFGRHQSHLLLIAAAPNHQIDPAWQSAVPPAVFKAISVSGPAVAIFGTGPYAAVVQANSDPAAAALDARLQTLLPDAQVMPGLIELGSAASGAARILMDTGEMRSANAGVCVAAVDPELGSVVESITFGDGPDVETWRLDRVVVDAAAPHADK